MSAAYAEGPTLFFLVLFPTSVHSGDAYRTFSMPKAPLSRTFGGLQNNLRPPLSLIHI